MPAKQIFDAYIVNTGNCDFVRASGGEMKVGSLRKLEIAYYTHKKVKISLEHVVVNKDAIVLYYFSR